VGVVGFLTGGGIGPLVRTFGASSDHVRSFELVTGTGDVLRVTPEQHAHLFWHSHRSRDRPDTRGGVLRRRNLFRRFRCGGGAARVAAVERRPTRVCQHVAGAAAVAATARCS
jgi:FAD/FMN-containing dehydrogenase